MNSTQKYCLLCGEVFPLDGFHRIRARSDGRDSYCKACRLDVNRDYQNWRQTRSLKPKKRVEPGSLPGHIRWARCEQQLSHEAFYPSDRSFGRYCRECTVAYQQEWVVRIRAGTH